MKQILLLIERIFLFFINNKIWLPRSLFIILDKIVWSDQIFLEVFLTKINPEVLNTIAEQKVLLIFHEAVSDTPAYKKFLSLNDIKPEMIKNIDDFKKYIPITSKNNYIKSFLLEERCRQGVLPKDGIIFRSAGIDGNPTYWTQALKEEDRFEVFVPFGIDYIFGYKNKNYKILNCWAFGTWPTAIDFTKSARKCGQMVNIGTDIKELIFTLKLLGNRHNYLISGYPPFLRNMIYEGEHAGLDWSDYKIDILTGGEGFVEEWRDFLKSKLGDNAIIASSYGSTDKGLGEGIETPLTIIIRNLIRINQVYLYDKNRAEEICTRVFKNNLLIPRDKEIANHFITSILKRDPNIEKRLPMLFQTVPITYYEEEIEKEISPGIKKTELVTTVLKRYASQPIIRYNIEDDSGIIGYTRLLKIAEDCSYNLRTILVDMGYNVNKILPLPFMYVYGRSNGTVSIDGTNIYPEEVGRMIENIEEISDNITSFMLNISNDYRFEVDLELKQEAKLEDSNYYADIFKAKLPYYSSGYRTLQESKFNSSDIVIKTYNFGQGPFENSPLINKGAIKYQYIGKKVFGR